MKRSRSITIVLFIILVLFLFGCSKEISIYKNNKSIKSTINLMNKYYFFKAISLAINMFTVIRNNLISSICFISQLPIMQIV